MKLLKEDTIPVSYIRSSYWKTIEINDTEEHSIIERLEKRWPYLDSREKFIEIFQNCVNRITSKLPQYKVEEERKARKKKRPPRYNETNFNLRMKCTKSGIYLLFGVHKSSRRICLTTLLSGAQTGIDDASVCDIIEESKKIKNLSYFSIENDDGNPLWILDDDQFIDDEINL